MELNKIRERLEKLKYKKEERLIFWSKVTFEIFIILKTIKNQKKLISKENTEFYKLLLRMEVAYRDLYLKGIRIMEEEVYF